ncbi:MAG: enolase C-terminal domain-like protein [Armatimonadota bacterium]|nr:enolase C-terminal domain-like protein [Armatimonadota bacterium]MDR7464451.1 enolase C-terminal domain-like protein [Armatimonadota bacterium]MDR7470501.1 enolase C-terminal domain-like protein [Armatimonadota bacterium]MDR7475473.1 enolase C-terminal domain-like protein [Armatimonadota bacterium]MDR7540266.1 enolase C-terminal domain-like protein [Armatimonadota bacterium]
MRIVGLDVILVGLPARRVHRWAGLRGPIGRYVVVRLRTDEGLEGWGETQCLPDWGGAYGRYYGETPQTVRHLLCDLLLPVLREGDPFQISALHTAMDQAIKGHPYAKAAVDIALHDLKGRALGVPVYDLLGGRVREWVPVGHSLGLMEVEQAAAEAAQAVREGIRHIKVKGGPDPRRDVAAVAAVRRAVGEDVEIRLDANQAYTVPVAIRTIRAMEASGLHLAEQPVEGIDELAAVARAVGVPLMADESAWTARDVLHLREAGAARYVSLYVTKPGGLYPARQMAAVLEAAGLEADVGGSAEFGIANAANLHLAAASPAVTVPAIIPVTTLRDREQTTVAGRIYTDDIITEPFPYREGRLRVPEGPGLGITVDPEKLERYRVPWD